MKEAGLSELCTLIGSVQRTVAAPARLYLVSRTSHLAEGWCDRVPVLELAGDAHLRQGFHLRQGYGGQDGGQVTTRYARA